MDNFQVAIDATATAMGSAGSAMQENSAYMESLEAQTTQLKATFQDLSNNVIDKELISSILNLANNALNALNTETGATITQWGLLTGALTGGLTIFAQVAKNLVATAKNGFTLVSAITGAGTAASGAAVGFGTLAATALPVAAALSFAVVAGWKLYNWLKDTNPTLEEATERLEDVNTQLENNRARIEEINNLPWNERTNEILAEKDALEKENEELLNQISHYQELRKEKLKDKYEDPVAIHGFKTQYRAVSTYGAEQSFVLDPEQVSEYEKMGYTIERVAESAVYAGDELKNKLTENVKKLTEAMADGSIKNLEYADIVYDDTVNALTELAETSDDYKDLLEQLNTAVENYNAEEKLRAESIESTDAEFQKLVKQTPALTSVTQELNGAYYTNIEALKQLITTSDEYKNGRITDEYETTVAVIENSKTRLAALEAEMSAIAQYGNIDSLAYQSRRDNVASLNQTIFAAERKLLDLLAGLHWTSSGTGGGSSSASSSTKKVTDAILEQFKSLQKDLEHQKEMGEISEEEYYNKLEELVKWYKEQATAHMKEYGLTVNQINQNMYQYEEEIYKGRAQLAEDLAEQQKKAAEEAEQAQKEALEQQQAAYETAINYVIKKIDEEIDKLQELRDQTEQYYDDKIDALNEANDELERQIQYEELLNNLAQAKDKQLYVFQNGQFQYVQDVEAIASAQAELDAYERDEALRQEVENLEKLKEQALAAIDEQIEGWEEYKEEWTNLVDQYQDEQDRLIAEQLLGINLEQENWNTRLTNLSNFVSQYNAILSQLGNTGGASEFSFDDASTSYSSYGVSGGGSGTTSIGGGLSYNPATHAFYDTSGNVVSGISTVELTAEQMAAKLAAEDAYDRKYAPKVGGFLDDKGYATAVDGVTKIKFTNDAGGGSKYSIKSASMERRTDLAGQTVKVGNETITYNSNGYAVSKIIDHNALGTLSARGGLSVVGEKGPELRVLNSGDGIIPADATRNLWDWANYNPKDFMGSMSNDNIFHIGNISLPNVKDAQSFVSGLKQLAYQRAYKRA